MGTSFGMGGYEMSQPDKVDGRVSQAVRVVVGLVLLLAGFVLTYGAIVRCFGGQPPPIRFGLDAFQIDGMPWTAIIGLSGISLTVAGYSVRSRRYVPLVAMACIAAACLAAIAGVRTGDWRGVPLLLLLTIAAWASRPAS
jgi:hypothetical protein